MVDRYSSFAALSLGERKGVDYEITIVNRETSIAIIAPHGGLIEPGTSQIASAIAATRYSYYAFEGLRPGRPHSDLHITSHRFDEPHCVELVSGCQTALAIHGRVDGSDRETVWMGGRNIELRETVSLCLKRAGFAAVAAPARLSAQDPENICNRGLLGAGAQLELPRSLRDRLVVDADLLGRMAHAVGQAIETRVQ